MRGFDHIVNKNLIKNCGYLNGKFTKGSATGVFDLVNPANGKVLTQLPRMGVKDAEDGAKHANEAFKSWKHTTGKERSKILRNMFDLMSGKYRDDLAAIITLEAGKPLAEAKGEVGYAASFYELYAEEAKRVHGEVLTTPNNNRRLLAIKQPVGVAAMVTPWNFPSAMITRKVGPALAAGCTVLIKPAEQTPLSALALCVIAEEAGVPPGVINCLTVGREEVKDVGTSLCHSKLIRKMSFTGSTAVGKWLMKECSTTMKKISMELGGNAPFIVFDDADLDVALAALMAAKFRNAGQACIASNRILVQEGVYDKFAEMITAAAGKIVCGDGFGSDVNMGPLINAQGLNKVVAQLKDSVDKGAKVTVGGSIHHELNANGGFFHMPTVITGVTKDMLPYTQETFGPLLPLIKFRTEEEAIAIANDTDFGLAGYACTRDLARAWRVSEGLETGMVGINEGIISGDNTPFGGVKESGLGREGGHWGIEEYLEVKYVCMGLGK